MFFNRIGVRISMLGLALGAAGFSVIDGGAGNVSAAPPPSNATSFTPMTPQRLVDTRTGLGGAGRRLGSGAAVDIQVAGRLGVPMTATAVEINVTAVDAAFGGYLQVIPTGRAALGASSTLNVDEAAQTIPNAAFAPLGDGGQITVFTTFPTDIVIDVAGYFTPAASATAGRLVALTPTRILDTRINLGYTNPTPPSSTTSSTTVGAVAPKPGNPGDTKNCGDFATYAAAKAYFDMYYPYYGDVAKLDQDDDGEPCETLPGGPSKSAQAPQFDVIASSTVQLQVGGNGGVPSSGVSAVILNVTAVEPAGAGFVQVAPTPVNIGASSNLNTSAGRTIANLVVVPLGAGGKVDLFSTVQTELVADVVGYFTAETAANSTAGLFVPIAPSRQLDTREQTATPLSIGTVTHSDVADVAPNAIAIAGNITVTQSIKGGYIQVAAPPIQPGASSNVNVAYDGQTIANAVVSPVAGGFVDAYNNSPLHEVLDVTGWFTIGDTVPAPPG